MCKENLDFFLQVHFKQFWQPCFALSMFFRSFGNPASLYSGFLEVLATLLHFKQDF
jgi:hypothetical protein